MRKFFEEYKKPVTIGAGLIFFLLVGAFTMTFTQEKANPEKGGAGEETLLRVASPAKQETKKIFVHVTGAVKRPGVYEVTRDARIFQAVEMAGGLSARADDSSLNLAEILTDGAHVHIPAKQEHRPENASQTPETSAQSVRTSSTAQKNSFGQIDINHASAKELEQLNGVGPAISKRIIDYRKKHGAFSRVEDLLNVKGIGEVKLQKMRGQILIRK